MVARFEILDRCHTPLGEVMLRRRRDPISGDDLFEVKLGEEFLMSSLFTVAEVEVASLALEAAGTDQLDVVVGGLGLGYTAQTVLDDPRVRSLTVVEALQAVIRWHEAGLVPVSVSSRSDARCHLLCGDFFSLARDGGLDPDNVDRRFDAIVVDIDHSPKHLLHPSHAWFYQDSGARCVADRLQPGGVFALWSNDPPDDEYLAVLTRVFAIVTSKVISFPNPLQDRVAMNTVYVASRPNRP